MAQTTDDSDNLLATGQDENIGGDTEKDPDIRPGQEQREESESPQASSEDVPQESGAAQSETPGKTEEKTETEKLDSDSSAEPDGEPAAEPDSKPDPESVQSAPETAGNREEADSEEDFDDGDDYEDGDYDEDDELPDEDDELPDEDDELPDEDDEDEPYDDSDDDYDDDEDESEEGGGGLNLITLLILLVAASLTAVYFTCTVKTVHVVGNNLYTSEEIAERVISDDSQLMHNSVFLTLLYMTPKAPKIPFEESVKVSLNSYDTITITVKDMDIGGFIPYAGKNLYFSTDGILLEISPLTVKDATFVSGLSVKDARIGSRMTSDDEAGMEMVLEILQTLKKYGIKADCVVLTKSGSIVMYMDEIKVMLGRTDFELKISKIAQIMPYLEGRSGTIDLTNYTSSDENIILK